MIIHSYHLLRNTLLTLLTIVIVLTFVITDPRTLPYLAERFVKVEGLSYSSLEGTLLKGIIVHDLSYDDALSIKRLQISYKVTSLLWPIPRVDLITADQVKVKPDAFPASSHEEDDALIPPFAVNTLSITGLSIDLKDDITVGLDAKDITFKDSLDVKEVIADVGTAYATIALKGKIDENTLYAGTRVTPTKTVLGLTDPIIKGLPKTLNVGLTATLDDVNMTTMVPRLILTEDANLSMKRIRLDLGYRIAEEYLTFKSAYLLSYAGSAAIIHQEGLFTLSGAYASTIKAALTQKAFPLPFDKLDIEVAGGLDSIVARADAGALVFSALSQDYSTFSLKSSSKALSLAFIPDLPDIFEGNVLAYESNATLQTSPFSLQGEIVTEGNITDATGDFDINDEHLLYKATVYPRQDTAVFKDLPLEHFSPLHVVYYDSTYQALLNIDAKAFNMTLFKEQHDLSGWGNLLTTTFSAEGTVQDDGDTDLTFSSSTPSLYELASTFTDLGLGQYEFYDAQLDINTTLSLSDKVLVKSRVTLPWYVAQLDSQTYYTGKDLFFEASLKDKRLRLDRYRLDILDHSIYSNRPSKLSIDKNGTIDLKAFWIFDTLRLSGTIDPITAKADLALKSERFHYTGPEGDVTAKVDIHADIDGAISQDIEGKIVILDGLITAARHGDYSITDDDIIIIQDVKPPSKTRRSINIAISAKAPLTYKHDEIEVALTPDFTLYQEPFKRLQLLGLIHIDKGEIKAGDKLFYLREGDVYLQGRNPINPYLNLHLKYTTLDRTDIEIYVANTLNDPVIVFTSSPPMSQDDILSYLLFGGPATSTFESSGGETTTTSVGAMLLGTGLKTIFSDTTGIQVDTLNILSDQEGKFGYEVGARLNRDIRIVYKNDTISSIIIQYSLNKWIRIDVDVRETGQGVNFLYIKDF